MKNKIALEIELGALRPEDLGLAHDGITNALAMLEAQGYTADGEIYAGLHLAGAFIEACQQAIRKKAIAKKGGSR